MDTNFVNLRNTTAVSNMYNNQDGEMSIGNTKYYIPGDVNKSDDKVVITMGLNATALEEKIAKVVEDRLINEFTKNARDIIMKDKYYYSRTRYSDANRSDLKDWVVDIFKEFMRDNREEIIQSAAKELAKSMQRSKPVRERFCDVLEEELNA